MPQPTGFKERLETVIGKNTANFARRVGEEASRIYTYTSGRSYPPMPMLMKIAEATGTNLHWLVTGEGPREVPPAAHVPIIGRTTAGPLAIKQPGDEDLITEHIEVLEGTAQTVRLDVAGLRITIRVEPSERREP